MSESITLVTAFFNIGRENFKAIPRSDDKYFKYFDFWARLRNNLVVYTQPNCADIIMEIRRNYGLETKTTIIQIDNIYDIEPEIYRNMKNISNDRWFTDFRVLPNATSNIAEYSYLMLLKSYFLKDAVERGLTCSQVAWIDFGFNHGGSLYNDPKEFDFEWKYTFDKKIYYFYYQSYDDKPIFEIVRRLSDCIMGCLIIANADLCEEMWRLNKQAMMTINDVGLIDDDQLLHLMSYRSNPGLFELVKSDWFLPLKEYGGDEYLKSLNQINNILLRRIARRIRNAIRRRKLAIRNCFILYRNLVEKN